MHCKNCSKAIANDSTYCNYCGARIDRVSEATFSKDNSNFGFAILGFFIPVVGLIFFLIYEGKKPKRAKSAGKGALVGFLTKIFLIVIFVILYSIFSASMIQNLTDSIESNIPAINDEFNDDATNEILGNYVDISFGEFQVSNNGYYSKTSLDITVKNKAEIQCSYYITIEAVDKNGARIGTDLIYADRLGAGQEIYLTAFEYVEQDKIDQFKNATFKVLEITTYDF